MEVEARLEGDHLAEGSWDLYEMIQAFLQAPSYHVFFEVLLIVWILRLIFFAKSYRSERTLLTEKEKDELIEEWTPEPLVPDTDEQDPALQNIVNRVIDGKLGKFMSINGRECLNLGTFNFLGMIGKAEIEEQAVKTMRQYGVGACGPRGFYGTLDVHLQLEEKLQEFMHCEEAIIYSYGFATIASIIPAYSKRGDVIFADEGVHFAVQQGITASRSRVRYFKHNDMEDLERVLEEQAREDKKNPKKAKVTRRFLVVEGLYMKYGDLCPLPKLVELKHKYKVRIFMDESISLGTLGKTGRGVTEYYNIDVNEIDLIAGSLENALGTIGGFCVGKSYVVDHQRLSGLGYCFSASAPPMLCQAAITALKILGESPELLTRLRDNARYLHQQLAQIEGLKVSGESISPVIYVHLAEPSGDWAQDRQTLQTIVQQAEDHGIALTCASYLEHLEHCLPPPSIRVTVNCELTEDEMDSALRTITRVVKDCLPQV